jgi:hypothetical protein
MMRSDFTERRVPSFWCFDHNPLSWERPMRAMAGGTRHSRARFQARTFLTARTRVSTFQGFARNRAGGGEE